MAYREHPVPAPLRGLAECGWTNDAPAVAAVENVLPDGCMDLVWTGAEILLAGPDTAPHPYSRTPGVAAAGLRFAPGVLPTLLGSPAAEVRDRRVPLGQINSHLARATESRIGHGDPPLVALAQLAVRLPGTAPERAIRAVAAHLGTGAEVAATASALGWSPRSLHRRCLAAFGYGPATLRRILRFRRALALLHTGTPPAEAAALVGYADQPHLSREVRALAGASPAQLVSGANRSTALPSGSSTSA